MPPRPLHFRSTSPPNANASISSGPLAVVTGADEGYAPHLAAMLHSLVQNATSDRRLRLYVFDGGIEPESRRRLTDLAQSGEGAVEVTWLRPSPSAFADLPTLPYISAVTYYRLLIPDLLPSTLDRALYLDADVIVERDVSALWALDLGDDAVAAAPDFGVPVVGAPLGIKYHEELGLPATHPYFNAGVLLMNLEVWRRDQITEQVFRHLQEYRDALTLADQEALNAVLARRWRSLDGRWNQTTELHTSRDRRDETKDDVQSSGSEPTAAPFIIHYTSSRKPWHPDCRHPLRHRYLHYLRSSGWYSPLQWWKWYGTLQLARMGWAARYYTRSFRASIHPRLVRQPRSSFEAGSAKGGAGEVGMGEHDTSDSVVTK